MGATTARRNLALAAMIAGRGMTATSLAREARLHRVTVSRVLNGRQTLSNATSSKLAAVLGSTPEALGLTPKGGAA
jgi:plasmid maintenance system antidote protein VapI